MNEKRRNGWFLVLLSLLLVSGLACSLSSGEDENSGQPSDVAPAESTETATPTPTSSDSDSVVEPTATPTSTPASPPVTTGKEPEENVCSGLSGEIEVRILVGPADAVGLEPQAVGSIPFLVVTSSEPFRVEGSGNINYADTLVKEWGTYEVTLNAQLAVQGKCVSVNGAATLNLVLEMSGDQLVKVDAEGFHGEYPWTGTQSFNLSFPVVEGATAEGEGWLFVLHVDTR